MKPLLIGCGMALVGFGWLFTPNQTITVPSPNMARAVQSFKGQFARRYANKQASFPVAGVLSDASAFPTTGSDTVQLETNIDGSLRQFTFAADGSSVVSDGRTLNGITFGTLLEGQNFQLPIDFPAHLVVGLQVTPAANNSISSVTMDFGHSVVLHTGGFALMPNQPSTLYLGKITVSDAGVVYTFADSSTAGSDGYVINMTIPVAASHTTRAHTVGAK